MCLDVGNIGDCGADDLEVLEGIDLPVLGSARWATCSFLAQDLAARDDALERRAAVDEGADSTAVAGVVEHFL